MLHIRRMTAADLPAAMVLKTEALWNQVEDDWRRFLRMQPGGCFVGELDGEPVGTTVTCRFESIAWVAMVLVARRVRGRGIGTALMRHALEYLDAAGVQSVRLDATPLGQPIYEKLGFSPEYTLTRYGGRLGPVALDPGYRDGWHVWAAKKRDHEQVAALDREVTGTWREKFLKRLVHERMVNVLVAERSGSLAGYLAVRPGSSAVQIGPCIGDFAAGAVLLDHTVRPKKGVFIDVPNRCEPMVRLVERAGLRAERQFVRMCRGPVAGEDAVRLLVSSGPELG